MKNVKIVQYLFLIHSVLLLIMYLGIIFLTGNMAEARLLNKIIILIILFVTTYGLFKYKFWAPYTAIAVLIWCILGDFLSVIKGRYDSFGTILMMLVAWAVYYYELRVLTNKEARSLFVG